MPTLIYPFLFLNAHFLTLIMGPDRTIRLYRQMGRFLQRLGLRSKPRPFDEMKKRILRGYNLLPFRILCLEQSIVTWYLLNLQGQEAKLKIGMSLAPLKAHAWVETPGTLWGEEPGTTDMKVVAEYLPWSAG